MRTVLEGEGLAAWRTQRLNQRKPRTVRDRRHEFEADLDRIVFSSANRRLANITQVVLAREGTLFTNRLTHSDKVAAVGRGLANDLLRSHEPAEFDQFGGLDATVVQAACRVHDMGHPPFGHIAERHLHAPLSGEHAEAITLPGVDPNALLFDGFEGNAQSFRIITRLSQVSTAYRGMNLTRATLNASLKYPWLRGPDNLKKWGAYEADQDAFAWARQGLPERRRTLEADIVDMADDVTYAVHDVEDFFRAGLIPLEELRDSRRRDRDRDNIREVTKRKWRDAQIADLWMSEDVQTYPAGSSDQTSHEVIDVPYPSSDEVEYALEKTIYTFPEINSFLALTSQRAQLRQYTSDLISRILDEVEFDDYGVRFSTHGQLMIQVLKSLTECYVIKNPNLTNQQEGQRFIVQRLLSYYVREMRMKRPESVPGPFREEAEIAWLKGDAEILRTASDILSSLTESRAIEIFGQLQGHNLGSVLQHMALP